MKGLHSTSKLKDILCFAEKRSYQSSENIALAVIKDQSVLCRWLLENYLCVFVSYFARADLGKNLTDLLQNERRRRKGHPRGIRPGACFPGKFFNLNYLKCPFLAFWVRPTIYLPVPFSLDDGLQICEFWPISVRLRKPVWIRACLDRIPSRRSFKFCVLLSVNKHTRLMITGRE